MSPSVPPLLHPSTLRSRTRPRVTPLNLNSEVRRRFYLLNEVFG